VYGPNGFLRSYRGSISRNRANIGITSTYNTASFSIAVNMINQGTAPYKVYILNTYTKKTVVYELKPKETLTRSWALAAELITCWAARIWRSAKPAD